MIWQKCKACGARLVTFMEINGHPDYCKDCHKKNVKQVLIVNAGLIVLFLFLVSRL